MRLWKLDDEAIRVADIVNIDDLVWTDRYQEAGEFSFTHPLSSELMGFLPIDSLISHSETNEIMIVEDYEISGDRTDRKMIVSGRSLETIFEDRINLLNGDLGGLRNTTTDDPQVFNFPDMDPASQVFNLMHEWTVNSNAARNFPNLAIVANTLPARETGFTFTQDTTLNFVMDILKKEDWGIKTATGWGTHQGPTVEVYEGVDRSETVVLIESRGDIIDSRYLYSGKKFKNVAYVTTRYRQTEHFVGEEPSGYSRKEILKEYDEIVTTNQGTANTQARPIAISELNLNPFIRLAEAKSDNNSKFKIRKDYNVGDIVSIINDLGEKFLCRVEGYTMSYTKKAGIKQLVTFAPYEET